MPGGVVIPLHSKANYNRLMCPIIALNCECFQRENQIPQSKTFTPLFWTIYGNSTRRRVERIINVKVNTKYTLDITKLLRFLFPSWTFTKYFPPHFSQCLFYSSLGTDCNIDFSTDGRAAQPKEGERV